MKEYKYPQPDTCDICQNADENIVCKVYTKEEGVEIWLTNQCDSFKLDEQKKATKALYAHLDAEGKFLAHQAKENYLIPKPKE